MQPPKESRPVPTHPRPSTFSIAACDLDAGEWGVAVASRFLAVGAVVPFARAGVGAVATQSYANTTYGPAGLALLSEGYGARDALNGLLAADSGREQRQVGIVDGQGRAATFTGTGCYPWAGGRTGPGYAAQGNILAGPAVVDRLAETFERESGDLVDRLVAALAAGQAAGGDSRGQQSAALLLVRHGGGYAGFNDRCVDLRVDDHEAPIDELKRLLSIQKLLFFPTRPEDILPISPHRAGQIQQILAQSGYRRGPITGVYDAETRSALRALIGAENLENRWREDDEIDRVVLEHLAAHYPAE
jgi:uncharacterized Ntn-hydrolase superfamily protein